MNGCLENISMVTDHQSAFQKWYSTFFLEDCKNLCFEDITISPDKSMIRKIGILSSVLLFNDIPGRLKIETLFSINILK